MAGRTSDPEKPKRPTGTRKRPTPDQYELKIRWDKARGVIDVTPTGVQFDFDSPLKVGTKYPVTLNGSRRVPVLDDRGHALPADGALRERPLLPRDRALLPLRRVGGAVLR